MFNLKMLWTTACLTNLLLLSFDWSAHERVVAGDRFTPVKDMNVAGADHLRRLIDKHIYNRKEKKQSRIMRFLFHGDTGTDSPLDALDVLDRPAIANIVSHAKTLHGHSHEVDFDYWERKVDFYTYFNYTGEFGEFDPFNPYAPSLVNQSLEEHKQKLGERSFGNKRKPPNMDARRHSRVLTRDEGGIYYAQEQHPHYAKLFTDLMLQAIYNTRLAIHETKEIRSRFRFDANYRIATLFSLCSSYMSRLKSLHAIAYKLFFSTSSNHFKVKFLHYLVVYEKALAAHTDIEACVQRIDAERRWMRDWMRPRLDLKGHVHGSNFSRDKTNMKIANGLDGLNKETANGPPLPTPANGTNGLNPR